MRAWLMHSFDGVEKLELSEVADPQPGPGQVLLRIRFGALNPADAFLAQAMYPAKPPLPHVLGRDGAGDVVAVGPAVENVRVGETVIILRCDVGVETWASLDAARHGGAQPWAPGAYDPDTHLYIFGTGNPTPAYTTGRGEGDNLFTSSIVALDYKTGQYKWHFQEVHHEIWDYDAPSPTVLFDQMYNGQMRKGIFEPGKTGWVYFLDRTNGQLLLANKFVRRVTWASEIGADGRPQLSPGSDVTCPDHATNWNGTAFSPVTGLYYVMALEKCSVKLSPGSWKTARPREEHQCWSTRRRLTELHYGRYRFENGNYENEHDY